MNLELLAETLAGEPPYRARQVWEWTARGAAGYAEMTNLPAGLRAELADRVPFSSLEPERESAPGATFFARSSMRMIRLIERRGFSRLTSRMSSATSGAIERL